MIGIIGAMDEEISLLKSKMDVKEEKIIANCNFIIGTLKGKEVVLLKSGIGKVNAAMSTTILHEKYNPEFVINTGSAGGFHPDLEVGDIVISTDVVHHDVDVTAFQYKYGQVPGLPEAFLASNSLIEKTMKAAKSLEGIHSMKGSIATGDAFMHNEERINFVRDKFPSLIAVEMEAAAVAQVCHQYETPFVIIRALSDIAGKESSISFEVFLEKAAANAAELIMNIIE
ncbi:methylthioadenosine nucleosidase /adenosylhomocysteine nucleosidase [Saliterribacillus persicus]|uniref:5'-methylthioadenosine/S-adenosylhomocysteine nucleosidase n=2 Tax=Saliterribacillus persicus TaxID=930114 RepID=A0A368XBQ8_9BACI|nr:methylthioadenosine nucleosidase /adenosylhomocysteine nucleosidase [Saliterribacillus persicus]